MWCAKFVDFLLGNLWIFNPVTDQEFPRGGNRPGGNLLFDQFWLHENEEILARGGAHPSHLPRSAPNLTHPHLYLKTKRIFQQYYFAGKQAQFSHMLENIYFSWTTVVEG